MSRVLNPRSSTGSGSTVRKFGGLKFVVASESSMSLPSRFIRSKSAVVGGACSTPAIAQVIEVFSMNCSCRSKIVSSSESKPTIKPASTQRPLSRILFTFVTRSPRRFWNFDDPFNASADGVSMPRKTYMKFASTIAASNSGLSARSMDASV